MVGSSDKKQPKTQASTELSIISITINTFSGFTTRVGQVHCNFLLRRWKLWRSIPIPLEHHCFAELVVLEKVKAASKTS